LDPLITSLLGGVPVRIQFWDGSFIGPEDSPHGVIHVRSVDAIRRMAWAPDELGAGRAYVAGDIDFEGDVFTLNKTLRPAGRSIRAGLKAAPAALAAARDLRVFGRPLPPPPEEARLHGRRHSEARDAAAIAHHYDVSNDFYEQVLGPSMTYSCAVFESPSATLEEAQAAKHELVCRKLGLEPGMRLLDVGCGWGSMAMHAAEHHGVHAVGVTISRRQAELAAKRVAAAGLADRVDIRLQDYREIDDGPYDAISSIGMFEHVGEAKLAEYFRRLFALLRPEARLLNHGISRPPSRRARFARGGFIERYVFPDGELHEVGRVVSAIQQQGFEARHVESLREHYALTLRRWVANLDGAWDAAVAEVGAARARVWRLYMAGSARNFEAGRTMIHQVLAVRADDGRSGMPLRPTFT
jgi:cyclopropane-fatty-acyl-phospholipid synthase